MASRTEGQVLWSTNNSHTLTSGSPTQDSDAYTMQDGCVAASVTLKADNSGTPASGDFVDFYLLGTTGDPDGASTDEYDTPVHAQFLTRLDTYSSGQGEDPAIKTVAINPALKGFKIRAESSAASNSIVVSSGVIEIVA